MKAFLWMSFCMGIAIPAVCQPAVQQKVQGRNLEQKEIRQVSNLSVNPAAAGLIAKLTKPGMFGESTPVAVPSTNPANYNSTFTGNALPNALGNDADSKYYLLDCNGDNRNNLLAVGSTNSSLSLFDKNAAGNIVPMGAVRFPQEVHTSDNLYFGVFSPENGATFLVYDNRANVFWHYQHNASNYYVFERPHAMLQSWVVAGKYLTGDFNGDGKTDLLAWDYGRNEFSVALYKPNANFPRDAGSLQPAGVWLSGWAQSADMNAVGGDFNGDGKDDIALVHKPSGEWWVALSTGTGFQPATGYKSGVWLKPWAIGNSTKIFALDVNGDGKCDLMKYDESEKSFQAVLSNGQYFDFLTKKEYIGGAISNPVSVQIGKLQGNAVVVVAHDLQPDATNTHIRRAVSCYYTGYRR